MDSLDQTIKNLQATLAGVKQTFNAIDKFQAGLDLFCFLSNLLMIDFGNVMAKLVEKIGEATAPIHLKVPQEGDIENTPRVSNIKDIVQEMKTKSHIVVLTGIFV